MKRGGPLRRVTRLSRSAGMPRAGSRRAPVRDTGPSLKTRRLVHERDGYACAGCGKSTVGIVHSVHHRANRGMGGTSRAEANSPEMLVLLCGDGTTGCHGRATRLEPDLHGRGIWIRSWDDPAAVPVVYATPDGYARFWLKADGTRTAERPEGAAA